MNHSSRIYVAGHTGLIGSAVKRSLLSGGFVNLIVASHGDLELTDTVSVEHFFDVNRPEFVVLAASTDPDLHDKTLQEISGTLVDKMLRAISTEKVVELNKWLSLLKNNPQLFLTKYEELVDYKTRLLKSIGEMR